MNSTIINLKRAYEPEESGDGYRIYIDRLWPRGLSHETFHYDYWDKEIAPSDSLREWFHSDPNDRWKEFEEKYRKELESNPGFESLKSLISGKKVVTLLYSSHDELHNNAVIVKDCLENQ